MHAVILVLKTTCMYIRMGMLRVGVFMCIYIPENDMQLNLYDEDTIVGGGGCTDNCPVYGGVLILEG